jgi:hypothetical protein
MDGEVVTVGNVPIRVYAVPGHTAGSAAYVVNGVVMVGDSADIASDGSLQGAPWLFSDSQSDNRASLVRLEQRLAADGTAVTAIVPSHSGSASGLMPLSEFARRKVEVRAILPFLNPNGPRVMKRHCGGVFVHRYLSLFADLRGMVRPGIVMIASGCPNIRRRAPVEASSPRCVAGALNPAEAMEAGCVGVPAPRLLTSLRCGLLSLRRRQWNRQRVCG